MKQTRRLLFIAMIVFSMVSGVYAQGSQESAKSDSSAKETIEFWNLGTENPDKKIYQYTVDKFNDSNSKYFIENIGTQNDTYKEKIIIAMSSGECPDMYTSWSGGPMNEYIDSGYAQPIDEQFNAHNLGDIIMDAGVAQATYKGKIYAIPMLNVTISGIFYNKEIFAKYGLEVPKTIKELEHVCDVLVKNGVIPFALANKTKWTGSMFFQNLAARYGGLEPFKAAASGEGTFEDDCFVYAGEKIQEWVKKGYFPEGVNSLSEDDGQSRQLMYQEKAAMTCNGSWYVGNFKADSEEFYSKIGWFSFPMLEGSSADSSIQIGTIGDQFISFNCTGDKLDAAVECVSHYFDDDSIQMMVENGKIPPVKDVSKYISDPVTKDILSAVLDASSTQLWYDQYLPPAVAQTHLNTCQEIFGLTMTPQKAAELLEASMEESLKE